ncbi:MAG: hypothetical protein JRI23_30530 [Deltaproteobacteria bacterium]|nr:hypothetical protein [Deltaproteobacteria bacterium]MBW2536522.1 hypothetical protein [Deltaproteobacteria bacterium]
MALSTMGLAACGGSAMKMPASGASPEAGGYDAPTEPAAESAASAGGDYDAPAPAPAADGEASLQAEAKAPARSSEAYDPAPRPRHRPGLGTEWGESRYSQVTSAPFLRADRSQPFAVGRLFYNDRSGIQAMIDSWGGSPSYRTRFPINGGHLEVALRQGDGGMLSGFSAGGRNYVTGDAGERYSIVIDNRTPGRIETVISVDGLDVIDGRPASFGKRGYLLEPHGHLEIEGFRRSEREVAAFRFGSVRSSYASRKHGDARNVGVIGFAFFHEQGDSPHHWSQPWLHDEANRRHSADPFPARYATPPR